MKKAFLTALMLLTCAFLMLSCDISTETSSQSEGLSESQSEQQSEPQQGESSSTQTPPAQDESQDQSESQGDSESVSESEVEEESRAPSFTFSVSSEVVTVGEKVTFSIDEGATIGDFDQYHDMDIEIVESSTGDTYLYHNGFDSEFTPNGVGKTTLKMTIKGIEASNTVTVYSLMKDTSFSSGYVLPLTQATLGVPFDIGIDPDVAHLYEVNGGECVQYNDDGTITFIGITGDGHKMTIKNTYTGHVFDPKTYSYTQKGFASAIERALVESGAIQEGDEISPELVKTVTKLDLTACTISSRDEFVVLEWLPNLKSLKYANLDFIDISHLASPSALEELHIYSCNGTLSNADLSTLTSLKKLSLIHSFDVVSDTTFTEIKEDVKAGALSLCLYEDAWLSAENIDDFTKSIFYTTEQLQAHLSANNGYIVPAYGYSHAAVVNCSLNVNVKVNNVNQLDLYNGFLTYSFGVSSTSSELTINLHNFRTQMDYSKIGGVAFHSTGTLRVNAIKGSNSINGADGTTSNTERSHETARVGIVATNLYIKCENYAKLSVYGGDGFDGWDGYNGADLSPSENTMENKQGQNGENGAAAISATNVYILSSNISLVGGDGGAGGDGGDGAGTNIFKGGYNGGNGGNGGSGGAPIHYTGTYSNTYESDKNTSLTGGMGGFYGFGGISYGLGDLGSDGTSGSNGSNTAVKVE